MENIKNREKRLDISKIDIGEFNVSELAYIKSTKYTVGLYNKLTFKGFVTIQTNFLDEPYLIINKEFIPLSAIAKLPSDWEEQLLNSETLKEHVDNKYSKEYFMNKFEDNY